MIEDALDTLEILCTNVLACEGDASLCEGRHSDIDKVLDVVACTVAGNNDRRVKGVDARLNDYVAQGECHALQTGRYTDSDNFQCHCAVDAQFVQVKMGGVWLLHQGDAHQKGSQSLRNDGGKCNTGNAHLKDDDKDQVQDHIGHAADKQEEQRAFGVAFGAQNRGTKGVDQTEEGADKIDTHIQLAHIDDVAWGGHQFQHRSGQEKARDHQKQAAIDRHGNGGVYRFFNLLVVSGADVAGNQNVTSHT